MAWFVYIVECANDSLYVGLTVDPEVRFEKHLSGTGAAHTQKCIPRRMIYREEHASLKLAVARERQLKGWSRAKKLALANGRFDELRQLAKRTTC
jgi:putative endonuclease